MSVNQVAVTVVAMLALYTSSAEACVGVGCTDPWTPLPRAGQSIPANVPALGLYSPGGFDERAVDRLSAIQLVRDGGQPIGLDLDAGAMIVLRPKAPLPAGETVVLRYPSLCFLHGADAGTELNEVPIEVIAAAPLPTVLGILAAQEVGRGRIPVNAGATCGTNIDATYADLSFSPDPALAPFLPVTGWALSVDGEPWATEEIGMVLPQGQLLPFRQDRSQHHEQRRILRVHAACGATAEGVDRGVSPGHHVARLEGTLLGTTTTLAVEQPFDLSCGGGLPTGCAAASSDLSGLALAALALALAWRRRRA